MTEETTEIRNMNLALKMDLINLLDMNDGWKLLMSMVTVDCDPNKSKKYTVDHMKLIEIASRTQQKFCSEIFLDEWGTSGEIRPTLKILMELLYDLKLIRAADCISKIIYGKSPMSNYIPEIDDFTNNCNSENFKTTLCAHQLNPSPTLKNYERFNEITFPYESLIYATNGFSNECVVGAGGFGKVFKGILNNQTVAIKRMEKIAEEKDVKQYLNEINIVLKLKHDNLLPLMAISYDVQPCIIYEFMENGSLLDCIACENRSSLLTWKFRIKLGLDVARGLIYLHTAFEKPFIHRDIKTANILLDNQMIAKIGDFGLTRNTDHTVTSGAIGTSAYMSPEAQRGDISVKGDVFSFGIVLLELLTGLAPYDEGRTGCDLLTYIEDIECPIEVLLDKRAGKWNNNIATKLYNLAIRCTAEKTKRPTMHDQDGVFETLENIQSNIE